MMHIPHSRPTLGDPEANRARQTILSGMVAQGPEVEKFETAFARKFQTKHGAAVSSGTAALHLVLLSLGVGSGDEVIIPSYVCAALLHAVHHAGATPVPADIEADSYNLDPTDVRRRITARTKALVVPHLFGRPANLDSLGELGIPIIEDCAQAAGGTLNGRPLGTFGKAAVFSFYATKVMTTGEGGMVISDSPSLIDHIKDLRDYDNRPSYAVRYNYKMTDLEAALGLSQLERLDDFIRCRRTIAEAYDRALASTGLSLPRPHPGHIYFRYVIDLPGAGKIREKMQLEGIACEKPVFRPLHRYLGLSGYPRSDTAWERALSIPIYPALTNPELDYIIEKLKSIYGGSGNDEALS
ncbi:MAG: DegT/DnrJ/EryC1/StrS family aminotransferase [Desulfosudaceae bacterium]